MLRRLLLASLFCGLAQAGTPPQVELTASPAWKGWSRPGRPTELDLRLAAAAATTASLQLSAGRQSLRLAVELQPGRTLRLQLPLAGAERAQLRLDLPGAAPQQHEVQLARSESPLLGLGLASAAPFAFDGFHVVALVADDLPRHAAAYAAMDALILDAPTLRALDPAQLAALLAHAADCGRIVVLNADARVQRALDGAGGCGGVALIAADSLAEADGLLRASLASSLPQGLGSAELQALAGPDSGAWNRVVLGLAVYLAAAALALLFSAAWPLLLGLPALASVAALVLLQLAPPSSQLVVWSEGQSAAPTARYQARQQFAGHGRGQARVAIPGQLAASVQACNASQAVDFEFDARLGQANFAGFETRLFSSTSLCYAGVFPIARAVAILPPGGGPQQLRNVGTQAWPAGRWLAGGRVHALPALAPGAHTTLAADAARPDDSDAVQRLALARLPGGGAAALWSLELGGVAGAPAASSGWLLLALPPP